MIKWKQTALTVLLTVGSIQASETAQTPQIPLTSGDRKGHNLLLEGGDAALMATRHRFHITYKDKVTGGCLPRPSRLRDQLELAMRRNHLKIVQKKEALDDELKLSALGFKVGSGYCAVSLTLTMESWVPMKVPYAQGNPSGELTLVPYKFQVGEYLLTGPRRSMQRRLEKVAKELGDQLYLQIARAKDEIFEKFPIIEHNYKKALRDAASR